MGAKDTEIAAAVLRPCAKLLRKADGGTENESTANAPAASHHAIRRAERLSGLLTAPVLGIRLQSLPVLDASEIEKAVQTAAQSGTEALITVDELLIIGHRARIVDLAMRRRLPVMAEFRSFATAGALMSYAPDQIDMWRRAATYVDKILKGAKPADLPVEQLTKFELVINLKTARALGLEIPPTLLARADEVIE